MLSLPSKGEVVSIPLYPPPVQMDDESAGAFASRLDAYAPQDGVNLRCAMMSRPEALEARYQLAELQAEERRRLHALRASSSEELEPDLFGDGYQSLEFVQAMGRWSRGILERHLAGVTGIQVGGADVGGDVAAAVDAFEFNGLLEYAASRIVAAQGLNERQVFC